MGGTDNLGSAPLALADEEGLRATLRRDGIAWRRIAGTSMLPTLRPGDVVMLKHCDTVEPGEVVAFSLGRRVLVHRVLRVRKGRIVCRGDNRTTADPEIPPGGLIGRVEHVVANRSAELRARRHVAVRRALRVSSWRVRRLWHESALLVRQLAGRPVGAPLPALGRSCGVEAPDSPLVHIAAGLFCRLDSEDRRRLLVNCRGQRAVVWAYPRDAQSRLLAAFDWLRSGLRTVGVRAGLPGDCMSLSGSGMPRGFVHRFMAQELADEIAQAGCRAISTTTECTSEGWLLRADLEC